MKKLFLILPLVFTASLLGMEVPDKQGNKKIDWSEIAIIEQEQLTLPLMYRHLPKIYCHLYQAGLYSSDVMQHIFSLQFAMDYMKEVDKDIPSLVIKKPASELVDDIKQSLAQYGYLLTVERLSRDLAKKEISICDVIVRQDTVLHIIANHALGDKQINLAKLFLQAAGRDVWKLLKAQGKYNMTALHFAVMNKHRQLITLLLNAAGDQAQELINIPDNAKRTAFGIANKKTKEIMRPYLERK